MQDTEFLDSYEKTLEQGLIKICNGAGLLDRELLTTPDLDGRWDFFIKEYVADAVGNFNDYPEAAIAWAGFLGMAVACHWDEDWVKHCHDPYTSYYGPHGWDDMDEHILQDIMGLALDSPDAKKISSTLQSCALATLGLIQHEGIETQTSRGFYVLSRSYTVLFRIGASIAIRRLGYKKVAVN